MEIRDARKQLMGKDPESLFWEAAFAQFDAAWRARWKGKRDVYPIEEIEKLIEPATEVLPDALFDPMLLAGIEEPHPDFNRRFIEPCVRLFGHRRVYELEPHGNAVNGRGICK